MDGVATTRYSIGGLSPFSQYEFRVMAVNNVGRGPSSSVVNTRTSEQAPSSPPLHIQARMLNNNTMLVQWEPPEEPNGQIRGYRVFYSPEDAAPLTSWQTHQTDDSQLTNISSLVPGITYGLRVLAFTSVGDGPLSDLLQIKTQLGGNLSLTLLKAIYCWRCASLFLSSNLSCDQSVLLNLPSPTGGKMMSQSLTRSNTYFKCSQGPWGTQGSAHLSNPL